MRLLNKFNVDPFVSSIESFKTNLNYIQFVTVQTNTHLQITLICPYDM